MKAKAMNSCLSLALLLILCLQQSALASNDIFETLDVINIPDSQSLKLTSVDISREDLVSVEHQEEPSKPEKKFLAKQFGPVQIRVNLNPFNLASSALRFDLVVL